MKIEILGWKSVGLRSPDITIRLERDGGIAPVSFIQMPNGTGKTTTLDMLRAALTGDAEEWPPEKVREYRDLDDAKGLFVLDLSYDGNPLTFEITSILKSVVLSIEQLLRDLEESSAAGTPHPT